MNNLIDIAKCPFCHTSGHPTVIDMDNEYWVACYRCGAIGPSSTTASQAIANWNRANSYRSDDESGIPPSEELQPKKSHAQENQSEKTSRS